MGGHGGRRKLQDCARNTRAGGPTTLTYSLCKNIPVPYILYTMQHSNISIILVRNTGVGGADHVYVYVCIYVYVYNVCIRIMGPTTTTAQFDLTVKHTKLKNRIMQYHDDDDDDYDECN